MKTKHSTEEFVLSHILNAAIMGGYVRDAILGLEWKDIDVFRWVDERTFIRVELEGTYRFWAKNADTGDMVDLTFFLDASNDYYKMNGSFRLASCPDLPGLQLIICQHSAPSPIHVPLVKELAWQKALEFPCGLSQAWITLISEPSQRKVRTTQLFDECVDTRIVALRKDCPPAYKKRMRAKFPDWDVVDFEVLP